MSLGAEIERAEVDRIAAAAVGPSGILDSAGPVDERFELASLTKLLVACAVLVAVEDGSVDLDQPEGPDGATLRHLLAHASGLDATSERSLAAPGTRRIYSNAGYEVIGRVAEAATGLPVAVLVQESVLDPLHMTDTTMGSSAATGAAGTVSDLVRLVTDLMAPSPVVMATSTRDLATTVAFPGLAGALPGFGSHPSNDWGLGFEIKGAKAPHWTPEAASPGTFGHFGRAGSLLWVDPTLPVALVALGSRPFGDWAPPLWRRLGEVALAAGAGGHGKSALPGDEKRASRQQPPTAADGKSAVVDSGVTR